MNAVKRQLIANKMRLVKIQTVLIHVHVTEGFTETGKYAQDVSSFHLGIIAQAVAHVPLTIPWIVTMLLETVNVTKGGKETIVQKM